MSAVAIQLVTLWYTNYKDLTAMSRQPNTRLNLGKPLLTYMI